MNLRDILRMAVSISVVLFCFSTEPCAAQEETKLTKSITMLPDRPSGIQMITKFWNEEHTQNSHFVLTFHALNERSPNPANRTAKARPQLRGATAVLCLDSKVR